MSQAPDAENRPTVLVVDDEEDLRDIMRRMLERRGFSTLVAGDPHRPSRSAGTTPARSTSWSPTSACPA